MLYIRVFVVAQAKQRIYLLDGLVIVKNTKRVMVANIIKRIYIAFMILATSWHTAIKKSLGCMSKKFNYFF